MSANANSKVITVNGDERPFAREQEITSLLRDMGIQFDEKGVALAVNGEVVPRAEWGSVRLAAGDHVEVVRAVQGG